MVSEKTIYWYIDVTPIELKMKKNLQRPHEHMLKILHKYQQKITAPPELLSQTK